MSPQGWTDPVTATVNGGPGTRDLGGEDDKLDQDVKRERRRRRARQAIDAEEMSASAGDDSLFVCSEWDDIDGEDEVPIGLDGIFPESGIMWVHGQPGSGKTILAYWVLMTYAKKKFNSGIYEVEMGQPRAKGLLLNLGAGGNDLPHIRYYRAEDPTNIINLLIHGRALDRKLLDDDADVLLYDAANPLLAAARLKENEASDVRSFVNAAVRPVSARGGLVIVLDHDNKDGELRGSSDKPAAGDAVFALRVLQPFARGRSGSLRINCTKDRFGTLLQGSYLDIDVVASPDGSLELKPGKWNEPDSEQVKLGVNESKSQAKIYQLLKTRGPMTAIAISRELDMDPEPVRSALRRGLDSEVFKRTEDKKWEVK